MLRSRTPAAFLIKTLTLNSPYWIIQIDPPAQKVSWRSALCVLVYVGKQWLGFDRGRGCCKFPLLKMRMGRPTSLENVNKFREEAGEGRKKGEVGGWGVVDREELCRHEREERGQRGGSLALCVYDWMRWVRGFHTHLWMLILSRAQAGLIFTARLNEGAD